MVIVEFIKTWGAYNAGERAGFMQRQADELVKTGHVKIAAKQPSAKAPAPQQVAAPSAPEADKALKSPQRGK